MVSGASVTSELFSRAKEKATISGLAGVKLYRAGKRRRGECPLCGSGRKKKGGGPFSVDQDDAHFKCWSCGLDGDVIALEQHLRGGTAVDAARRLFGDMTLPAPVRAPPPPVIVCQGPSFAERFAAEIWAESVPARGTLVQRYLMSRAIRGSVLLHMVGQLRFHPRAFYAIADGRMLTAPAMLARPCVPGPDGHPVPTGGVHITYLSRDGSGKAHVPEDETAKKMFGPQSLNGMPGGVWLTAVDAPGPLLVGEGIESTGSMGVLHGAPARLVATLALDRMQGGYLTDRFGRFDPDLPMADPERPGFTWPEPETAPWGEIIIGVDHDMKPKRCRVRRPTVGGTAWRMLDATERARLCGALAAQSWKRTCICPIHTVAPPAGEDFNDKLIRETVLEPA